MLTREAKNEDLIENVNATSGDRNLGRNYSDLDLDSDSDSDSNSKSNKQSSKSLPIQPSPQAIKIMAKTMLSRAKR
jgi:hypothetical protein